MYQISIVIPVYNCESYIAECVNSVIDQDPNGDRYEIICIDDGSTDGSLDLLLSIKKNRPNMLVLTQTNHGISYTRNRGMQLASGEYLMFLDSDDALEEGSLSYIYKKCHSMDLDGYFFDGRILSDGNDPIENGFLPDTYNRKKDFGFFESGRDMYYAMTLANKLLVNVFFCAIRRKTLNDAGITFVEGLIHEDEVYSLGLMNHLGKVMHENKRLYVRRVRTGSIMTGTDALIHIRHYREVFKLLEGQLKNTSDQKEIFVLRFKMSQIIRSISTRFAFDEEVGVEKNLVSSIDSLAKNYDYFDLKTRLMWFLASTRALRRMLRIILCFKEKLSKRNL